MSEMARVGPQKFFSFNENATGGTEVDIMGTLVLMTDCGNTLPEFRVRMVPGQVDDLLVAAPDLNSLQFSAPDPERFLLSSCGLSVLSQHAASVDFPPPPGRQVILRELVVLSPHEVEAVQARVVGAEADIACWLDGLPRPPRPLPFRTPHCDAEQRGRCDPARKTRS
jgi:hypothetical protein